MKTPGNLRIQVSQALAIQVLNGTFPPGATLPPEGELCHMMGVSRTTVRGAVQSLVAKGLIEVGPSRGTRVLPKRSWNLLDSEVVEWLLQVRLDARLIEQIYEMRECFEPKAAVLAAARGTDADLSRIKSTFEVLAASRTGSQDEATAADVAFHTSILTGSGNDFIASFSNMVSPTLRVSFEVARRRKPLSLEDIEQHRAIMEAILHRDAEGAAKATEALLATSKRVQMEAASALDKRNRIGRLLAEGLSARV